MLTDEVSEDTEPAELLDRYRGTLREAIEAIGVATVIEDTDIAASRIEATRAGDAANPPLTVSEAARILALNDGAPSAEALVAEVRDLLLLGMSSAVLDVDALAAELEGDLDPTTVQQKIEGRQPMTLEEYAAIRHVIVTNGG